MAMSISENIRVKNINQRVGFCAFPNYWQGATYHATCSSSTVLPNISSRKPKWGWVFSWTRCQTHSTAKKSISQEDYNQSIYTSTEGGCEKKKKKAERLR